MRDDSNPRRRRWLAGGVALGLCLVGASQVFQGLQQYDPWLLFAGISCLLIAMQPVVDVVASRRTLHRWWLGAWLAIGYAGLGLAVLAFAGSVFGFSPVAWLGWNRNVAPAQLVGHPLLYNGQPVTTSGRVVGAHDRCYLEVRDPTSRVQARILLAVHADACAGPVAPRVRIAGTYRAFRDPAGLGTPYVLRDVRIDPADAAVPRP